MKKKNTGTQGVLEHLVRKYGSQVLFVQELEECVYRSKLSDGSVVGTFITEDGELISRLMDQVGA